MYYSVYTISKKYYTEYEHITPVQLLANGGSKTKLRNKAKQRVIDDVDCLGFILFEFPTVKSAPIGLEFYSGSISCAKSIWGMGVWDYLKRDYLAFLLKETSVAPFKAEIVYPTIYTTIIYSYSNREIKPVVATCQGDKTAQDALYISVKATLLESGLSEMLKPDGFESMVRAALPSCVIHSVFTTKSLPSYKQV